MSTNVHASLQTGNDICLHHQHTNSKARPKLAAVVCVDRLTLSLNVGRLNFARTLFMYTHTQTNA